MAAASLVLGIISVVIGCFLTGFQWVGAIVGILGIIFGVKGKQLPEKAGMAKAGFVLSIIGTILSLIVYVACVACVASIGLLS